jgi:hypothetical protein
MQSESTFPANRRNVIDFVGAPMPLNTALYPADDMYMQASYAPVGPPVYTMAGYPPAPGQPPAGYMQAAYPVPLAPLPQGFATAYTGSPYCPYPINAAAPPQDTAQRGVAAQPALTEETLQQKVDSKIDAIMTAHKTDMLSQQISRLTDKVQKLSNNIELSQSERGGLSSSSSDTTAGGDEMSRRLRKLAAESSRRAGSDSQPTPLF